MVGSQCICWAIVEVDSVTNGESPGFTLKLVEDKMKQTFQYAHELLKQLGIVKPTSPLVYVGFGSAALGPCLQLFDGPAANPDPEVGSRLDPATLRHE